MNVTVHPPAIDADKPPAEGEHRPNCGCAACDPDEYCCVDCDRVRDHTVQRLNLPGTPRLCDDCFKARPGA
jgi:hypothetical protein